MKIKTVSFENYKAFFEKQTMQLKPITILIGKNSSGKSSIAKLFTLLENSLSGNIDEPLLLKNNGVELGGEFRDLVYKRQPSEIVTFGVEFDNNIKIEAGIVRQDSSLNLIIDKWHLSTSEADKNISLNFIREANNINRYTKNDGTECEQVFKGIVRNSDTSNFRIDVDYIGPFRILPERQFHLTGQLEYKDTGVVGENAYAMLGVSKLNDTALYRKVGEWYKQYFDRWELVVEANSSSPYVQILLQRDNVKVNIVDVGQGMNQALPLVVRANIKREDSIIVLEQPELHLHPAAHGDLMELFAKSAKENNQTFIIETHSENMLLRLRRLIVENKFGFNSDDVVIYWVEDVGIGGQELREITIDEDGVLSDWPEGVFSENLDEIIAIRKSLKQRKNNQNDTQI